MLDILNQAGWPIWLLVATSVLGLALIIERFLSLRKKLIVPPRVTSQVMELIRRNNDTPESIAKLAASSPLGRVLAEVMLCRHDSDAQRNAAVDDVGKDVAHRLNRYLPALATIAVIGPLMGLFGTVVGMIEIFASYSPAGGDPSQLARGISIALYNTGFGIIIAIPALIFHRYFRSRVDDYLHQMELEASALNRLLARKPPGEAEIRP
ncbi:MotA/TolQ/ExbB proton channel family protein [Paralcaligenes ureilyticus]|uniref:Biopolymer transport protein ExbB n=1 Tax=Paralcaligenes ureilyticus TaxID=627131 RepID=A0A4V2UXQ6_9BURK|nr:MotA/TolQ/ExbB proton channel family protein [Paralcaligenes ureilyticus]TCT04508.1 biopolymer transport protein ExbB [Paralcaligenes ureilyticus]